MGAALLLEWHYAIFFVPLVVAGVLLLLSAVKVGHRHSGPGRAAGHHAHAAAAHPHAGAAGSRHAHAPAPHATAAGRASGPHPAVIRHGLRDRAGGVFHSGVLLSALGIDRAPAAMVLSSFCVAWGVVGCWANELFLKTSAPSLSQMAPSLAAAAIGGAVGARLTAELAGRILPADDSYAVSRNALFGLIGEVVFPVTGTSGRIHVYDEHGTLHDEACRAAPGCPEIEKGRRAMIIDVDVNGRLCVEEMPSASAVI